MHAPGKGIASSALPYRRAPPSWLKTSPEEVVEQITKLARKGLSPSQIGVILRDSHGIPQARPCFPAWALFNALSFQLLTFASSVCSPQVRFLTGNKILRILKSAGMAPELPEDLYCLIKKAVAVRTHLGQFRKDKDAKFRLILIESRIHRLARYYKSRQVIAPSFKYESATASALVA